MRLGSLPDNVFERVLLTAGNVPTVLMDTIVANLLGRTVMAATRFGIFDALAERPLTSAEVAARCATDPDATEKWLFALAAAKYLEARDGRYDLGSMARRWLLRDHPQSLHDAVLHRYIDQLILDRFETYLQTGEPFDLHHNLTPEQWDLYQRGQRSHAVYSAPEVARRTPAPKAPNAMLDIGGAHGHYAAALCRRHPTLRATILDLPEAVQRSAPRIAQEGLGDRLQYRAGDALSADLGTGRYDLVFISNLVHHFDEAQNRDLMRRVAAALAPGGSCVILEIIRARTPKEAGQVGGLTALLFAASSASGTWTFEEMAAWQEAAGLRPIKPIRLRMSPGYGLQAALKPLDV